MVMCMDGWMDTSIRDVTNLFPWQTNLSMPFHPPRHSHGDPTSLAPHERLTDLAVVPREKPDTGAAAREQPRDSPVIESGGPSSPAGPSDQARDLSPNASGGLTPWRDRKSTRLNSSHQLISYAVFCLKQKKNT